MGRNTFLRKAWADSVAVCSSGSRTDGSRVAQTMGFVLHSRVPRPGLRLGGVFSRQGTFRLSKSNINRVPHPFPHSLRKEWAASTRDANPGFTGAITSTTNGHPRQPGVLSRRSTQLLVSPTGNVRDPLTLGFRSMNRNRKYRTVSAVLTLILAIASAASAEWKEKVLYSFQGGTNDGAVPAGGVVFDKQGNMYGATTGGDSRSCTPIRERVRGGLSALPSCAKGRFMDRGPDLRVPRQGSERRQRAQQRLDHG